ncbi:MAG TPA: hypothetical protein VJ464_19705 [Blastocatellia bacterium]|nr:hypothetical protein [Blastocatellia bacterium]
MKRITFVLVALILLASVLVVIKTARAQRAGGESDAVTQEQWEYLVVTGPQTNLTPSGNSSLRKESVGFSREDFVVEQQMDKLGAKGWELVSVSGAPGGPVYYFKRRK